MSLFAPGYLAKIVIVLALLSPVSAFGARIGFFAGTFDPPHPSHENIVKSAMTLLDLDEVVIFVNRDPKNKPHASSYSHRLFMASVVFSKIPGVRMADFDESEVFDQRDIGYYDLLASESPDNEYFALAGSDLFSSGTGQIINFFDSQNLYQVVIMRGQDNYETLDDRVILFNINPTNLKMRLRSSTAIRSSINLLGEFPDKYEVVLNYVLYNHLYPDSNGRCESWFF